MKLRIYPKKDVVLAQLAKQKASLESDLVGAKEKYEKDSNSPLYVAANIMASKSLMLATEDALAEVTRQVELLESHTPEECMMELEI